MKLIPLTQGKMALVDDEDYEKVRSYKWYLLSGYAVRHVFYYENGKRKCTPIFMHRLILNTPPELKTDHKNGNKLDNRRHNLRSATAHQNGCNQNKTTRRTSSIFKGVCFERTRRKWKATFGYTEDGKKLTTNLGRFDDEIAAAQAYNAEALRQNGEFAKLNPV